MAAASSPHSLTAGWTPVVTDPSSPGRPPGPRSLHAAAVCHESLFVFGGYDGSRRVNDFHGESPNTVLFAKEGRLTSSSTQSFTSRPGPGGRSSPSDRSGGGRERRSPRERRTAGGTRPAATVTSARGRPRRAPRWPRRARPPARATAMRPWCTGPRSTSSGASTAPAACRTCTAST